MLLFDGIHRRTRRSILRTESEREEPVLHHGSIVGDNPGLSIYVPAVPLLPFAAKSYAGPNVLPIPQLRSAYYGCATRQAPSSIDNLPSPA